MRVALIIVIAIIISGCGIKSDREILLDKVVSLLLLNEVSRGYAIDSTAIETHKMIIYGKTDKLRQDIENRLQKSLKNCYEINKMVDEMDLPDESKKPIYEIVNKDANRISTYLRGIGVEVLIDTVFSPDEKVVHGN